MDYGAFCYFLFNIYLISSCQLWSCFFIIFWQKLLAEKLLNFHQRTVKNCFWICLKFTKMKWKCIQLFSQWFADKKKCILYESLLEVDIVNDIFLFCTYVTQIYAIFVVCIFFYEKKWIKMHNILNKMIQNMK